MERLTSIVAVVRDATSDETLIDKVVALARHFGARVELLLTDPGSMAAIARHSQRFQHDNVTCSVYTSGDALTEFLLQRQKNQPVDLVVKSPAGEHSLRRIARSSEDLELAERLPVPLMLAGYRPWRAEPRFAAAVDVSDRESEDFARATLQAGGWLSLGCHASLDVLYSEREQSVDESARMTRAVRLAQLAREFRGGGSDRLEILRGPPEITLPPLIANRHYDLLVLGAVPRHLTLRSFVHSLTSELAESTRGDVLLVKPEVREIALTSGAST